MSKKYNIQIRSNNNYGLLYETSGNNEQQVIKRIKKATTTKDGNLFKDFYNSTLWVNGRKSIIIFDEFREVYDTNEDDIKEQIRGLI